MQTSVGLDHIGVVGPDLGQMEDYYRYLGFRVAPRCELVAVDSDGSTRPLGQISSHLVFSGSYVELTAVTGNLDNHHLGQAIKRYFGLHIVALLSQNVELERNRIQQNSLVIDPVSVAGRSIDYPSGKGTGLFRWFRINENDAPDAFFCFVEHKTPDLVFDAALNSHPNGARELGKIFICVDDPQECATRIGKICDGTIASHDGYVELGLGERQIVMQTVNQLKERFEILEIPPLPFAAGFTLVTDNLEKTRRYFEEAKIQHFCRDGRLWILPTEFGQPIVEFVQHPEVCA